MIRRSSDSRQLIGGKGNYAPASASDNLPFLLKIASTPEGFGGKGIRTPDFQLAKLALYQLSYAPAFRIAECRLAIADFKKLFSWVPAFLGDSDRNKNAGCRSCDHIRHLVVSPSRSVRRGEKCSSDTGRVDRPPGNLAGFVDVPGLFKSRCVARGFESVEICHHAVFPNKSAAISVRVAGKPDHLPLLIDSIGFAVHIAGKETETLHSARGRPDECLEKVAIRVVRRTSEANHIAALVNVRRRVPPRRAKISKIDNLAVVPKQRMLCRETADSLIADSGNADRLSLFVDACRRA